MLGSSSHFGASSPSPFGYPAATNPFGANPNPFGANSQASNPFEAKPFGSTTPAFGAQTGSSLFGSGTSTGVFAATVAPAFGASSSTFGGSSTTPALGAFGQQKPASPFGGFGATQPQQNLFGSPSFGQSRPAFGSQPFGSTAPAFGAQSAPAFGSTTTPLLGASAFAFGASSTPAFGASPTPASGAASFPAFGAALTPAFGALTWTWMPAFGASAPAFGGSSVFGQTAPAFGASTGLAFGSTPTASPFGTASGSAFGSSFGTSSLGGPQQQRVGSRVTPYTVTNDTDAGVGAQAGKFLLCISAMNTYKDKQLEELRWEDDQASAKGGPNPTSTSQSAAGGVFGQQPPATSRPFGSGTTTVGQTSTPKSLASTLTMNPFGAMKPAIGNPTISAPAFGASTPAFGSSAFESSKYSLDTAIGQMTSSPVFGSTPSPFGQTSASAFGNSTFGSSVPSLLGQSTPAFGTSSPAFRGAPSTPAFGSQTSAFGGGGLVGNTQAASSGGGLFGTSPPAFGASPAPAFGQSQSGFSSNLFGITSTPDSIFGQTKPAGLTQSTPSSGFGGFGPTSAGQNPSAFSFPSLQTPQPGAEATNTIGGTLSTSGVQNTFAQQQPMQNVMSATLSAVTNPFGTLPAMPQIITGQRVGFGTSVQYGISSTPVSEKPTQVRVNTLLTPRHITQRSKVRLHARRYRPKRNVPKISFFSNGKEALSTPKADVMFVPRENSRSLFI